MMKLKSKDEIIIKLIEEIEAYSKYMTEYEMKRDFASDCESPDVQGVNMLKWVLNIPTDYTIGETNND